MRINFYTFGQLALLQGAYSDKCKLKQWMLDNDVCWYYFPNHICDYCLIDCMWEEVAAIADSRDISKRSDYAQHVLRKSPVVQNGNAFIFWSDPMKCDAIRPLSDKRGHASPEEIEWFEEVAKIQEQYIRDCDLQIFQILEITNVKGITSMHEDVMYKRLSRRDCVTREIIVPFPRLFEEYQMETLKTKYPNAHILHEWGSFLEAEEQRQNRRLTVNEWVQIGYQKDYIRILLNEMENIKML